MSELKPSEAIEILESIYPSKRQIVTGEYPDVAEALDLAINTLSTTKENTMTGHEYQVLCLRTAGATQPEDLVVNGVMGLNGEAGECIDIVKKHMFQKHELDAQHLEEELGDVSWYLAITAAGLGVDLDKIFEDNIAKLKARYPEGFDADRSINRA